MADAPQTSITLLADLANGTASTRWTEFITRYEGPMRAYLQANHPSVEADDVIQETLLALTKALPNYHYTPDEHRYFYNYLIGIVRHKALDQIERRTRENEKRRLFGRERPVPSHAADHAWQKHLLNAALEQLLADSEISSRNREIFRHVALLHEKPDDVARAFGTTRGNVDVIKKRLIAKLTALVNAMAK